MGDDKLSAINQLVNIEALTRWMDSKNLGHGALENIVRLAGGTQNILLKFVRDGNTYVLRRPPESPRLGNDETMLREATVLAALNRSNVPHPNLIALCDDTSVIGTVFYLMQEIKGFNVVSGMPEMHASSRDVRRAMGLSLIDSLAALGKVDYLEVGLDGFGNPDNFLERQVPRWRKQLESYSKQDGWPGPSSLPHLDVITSYLEENIPTTFMPGIMHGDFNISNVMFDLESPQLSAIVDWELATIGDPLLDLGWVGATWKGSGGPDLPILPIDPWDGFPTFEELVVQYAQNSERDLSNMRWYVILACYKLAILLEGTHARACAGKAPKATGDLLHNATIGLMERALHWKNRDDI